MPLFSFNLLVNVVSHDAIVRVVLISVVALVKYQQCEKAQGRDITVQQRVLHDLWSHHNHIVLRRQITQRQFGVLVSTQTESPQCAQILLEHAFLLCHKSNGRNKEYYFWFVFVTNWLPAFEMMLTEYNQQVLL